MKKQGLRNVHSEPYKAFLKRLKESRLKAKLNQAEVAKRLGKPQSYVSKCESGERRMDVVEVAQYAKVVGKPVGFFVS